MCGIAGFWDRRTGGTRNLEGPLTAMTDAIAHRGPDDSGVFVDGGAGVGLGSRRLAIVDLSPKGHQPMVSDDERYVVAYNGEIYNFVALREELEGHGQGFRGSSDTEVLVAGIKRFGLREMLQRCNGMFALAVWDRVDHRLHLARDRFGEKPLYYGWSDGVFLFGSELKAILAHGSLRPEVDRDVLALYFSHNCVPAPYTIYKGIAQLAPGSIATLDTGTRPGVMPRPEAYWTLRATVDAGREARRESAARLADADDHGGLIREAVDDLDAALGEAVRIRMHADVPLGAFLSGGIDSSVVVALMQARHTEKVKTFTIAFDDAGFNEAPDARRVAEHLGTEHTELVVTDKDALETIPKLPRLYDEPFADSSQIPTALLSGLARAHVTVASVGGWGRRAVRRLQPVLVGRAFLAARRAGPSTRAARRSCRPRRGPSTMVGPWLRTGGTCSPPCSSRPDAGDEDPQGRVGSPGCGPERDLQAARLALRRSDRHRPRG